MCELKLENKNEKINYLYTSFSDTFALLAQMVE